ncbi:MAG: protein kinase [Candidatus Obscuribacterales bacterium]|nr:protein kinase [Candidatus Obscuribacterales bacterium]
MTDQPHDGAENIGRDENAAPDSGRIEVNQGDKATRALPQPPTLELPDIPRTPLQDKYEFIASIGAGGAGVIYKAKQLPIGRLVAIKMIHSHLMTPTAVKRFQQEATTVGTLSHPNIIAVYDFGVSEGDQPFMVMDYIDGTPLSKVLDDLGALPTKMAISIAMQLCDGLAHAHARNILHRDLKPSNIMMVPLETGGPDLVKILDFGLAKMIYGADEEEGKDQITKTGETVGTPAFMSPEQVMGKTLDRRTDIYSLGCVLYHCLTARPPFVGRTRMETMLQQLNQQPSPINGAGEETAVDPQIEEIVLKLLEKNPDDRFQTMMDVKEALEAVYEGAAPAIDNRIKQSVNIDMTSVSIESDSEPNISTPDSSMETKLPTTASPRTIFSSTTGFLFAVLMLIGIAQGLVFLFPNLIRSADEIPEQSAVKKSKEAKVAALKQWGEDHRSKGKNLDDMTFEGLVSDPRAEEASSRLCPEITDDALVCLDGKTSIRVVDLSNAQSITDKGVRHLSGLNVSQLSLDNTGVGDGIGETLVSLRDSNGRSSIQELDLSATRVTNAILPKFNELKNLKELDISSTALADDAAASFTTLKLRKLDVGDTKLGDRAAKTIGTIDSLVALDLSNTKVSNNGIKSLANLNNLEQLNLSNTKVTDEAAPILAKLPKLAVLNLSNTRITAQCFPSLKSSDSIGFINISKCKAISPQQAVEFEHEMDQLKAVRVQVGED